MQLITTHIQTDFDAFSSVVAATLLYPEAKVVFPGAKEKLLHRFLEQQPPPFKDLRLKEVHWNQIDTLILVDTRHPGRIGPAGDLIGRKSVAVHVYDHHEPGEGDVTGQPDYYRQRGANTTMMIEILREKGLTVTPLQASFLALGIYEDTGNLTYAGVTEQDFQAVAWLKGQGADLGWINRYLQQELDHRQVAILHEALDTFEIVRMGGQDIGIAMAESESFVEDLALVAHKLRTIEKAPILFLIVRIGDRIQLIARGKLPGHPLDQVAAAFGGGGHQAAASATITGMTFHQVRSRLLEVLREHYPVRKKVADIMASPARTVSPEAPLNEASLLMNRAAVNTLCVTQKGRLQGILTRQILDRALYHQLGQTPVSACMETDYLALSPDASVQEAKARFITSGAVFAPVVAGQEVVGVITRKEILKLLYEEAEITSRAYEEHIAGREVPKRTASGLFKNLPPEIQEHLALVRKVADDLHINAYMVGGIVRDLLLGVPNDDLDLVVEGDAWKFAEALARISHQPGEREAGDACGCKALEEEGTKSYSTYHAGASSRATPQTRADPASQPRAGEKSGLRAWCGAKAIHNPKFHTAKLQFADGGHLDVAQARTEYYEHPVALPTVEPSTIQHDLSRRDFTINAVAVQLNDPHFGKFIDFFGGLKDVKDKHIRVIHSLSFIEDPTRIFRAIRFAHRFGFTIGKQTLRFLRAAVEMKLFDRLSGERLHSELQAILSEADPAPALQQMEDLKLLPFLHPRLHWDGKKGALWEQVRAVHDWYHYAFLKPDVERWFLLFMVLVEDLKPAELKEAARRLALRKAHLEALLDVEKHAERLVYELDLKPPKRPSETTALCEPFPVEVLLQVMARCSRGQGAEAIQKYLSQWRTVKADTGGEDLMALGFPPGPLYTEILNQVRAWRLDEEVATKEEEMKRVREVFGGRY